jgi:hypothetical protein
MNRRYDDYIDVISRIEPGTEHRYAEVRNAREISRRAGPLSTIWGMLLVAGRAHMMA